MGIHMDRIDIKVIQYNAKLAQMQSKVAEIPADMKEECLSQVENLEKKRDEFVKNHGQLKTISGHGLEAVKGGAERAWNELEEAFDKADVFILKKKVGDSSNQYFDKCDCIKHWNDREL